METSSLILWGAFSALIYYMFFYKSRRDKMLENINSPPAWPFIGHTLDFFMSTKEDLFPMCLRWVEKYGPIIRTFGGSERFVMITDAKYIEKILTSTVHITKGMDYDFLRPWLGDGLLLSDGQKWAHHRKMLTPSFHFKILEEFLPMFNKGSMKFVKILKEKYGDGSSFDFEPLIKQCTLDIICETAMGKSLNAMEGQNDDYCQAVREFAEVMQYRAFRPWLKNEFIFKLSSKYKQHVALLNTLHGFTDGVIRERKLARKSKTQTNDDKENLSQDKDSIYFGKAKKKNAFLDLLLDLQEEVGSSQLTDVDIREQTDTFMFAGHDTTSVSIGYTMFALGAYPEIQAKVREEIESIFGDDKERPITTEDISKMKYLDAVIKESLRIYPSVPFIQRHLRSDLKLDDDITLPADVTVMVFIYGLHLSPNYFPEPKVFRPERFLDGENKNAFAYIPFSAGGRNCIGQKFANMEQKVIVSNLIRNFNVKSVHQPKDLNIVGEITLRSPEGILLNLTPR